MRRIAIHSAPRSGSTWLGSIFDSHPRTVYKLQPLFSYALKDRLSPHSSGGEIDSFFEELQNIRDDFMDQKEGKEKGIVPHFEKDKAQAVVYKEVRYHHILENLLKKDPSVKVVGLIRNPLAVISSWLKAPKEFRADRGWKVEEEWRYALKKNLDREEEFNGYEKWKEVTRIFLQLQEDYASRFYLLRYDDLLGDTEAVIEELFTFCGLEMHDQTRQFIQSSTSKEQKDAYAVYKKKKEDTGWRKELPAFIKDAIMNDPEFQELNARFRWIQ